MTEQVIELTIEKLAGLGDGVGYYQNKPVYVPYSCAGDRLQLRITPRGKDAFRGRIESVITPSAQRGEAACVYFGACGGCQLQHLTADAYHTFKQHMVETLGFDKAVIAPLLQVGAHSRRRMDLAVGRSGGKIAVGYHAAGSHRLVAITQCPVSEAPLSDVLHPLTACLNQLGKGAWVTSIRLTLLDKGIDLLLEVHKPLPANDVQMLTDWAKAQGVVRVAAQLPEQHARMVYDSGDATIRLGGADIMLPPGAFLQASRQAQQWMSDAVCAHLAECRQVADLYAGCGTYSFPLAAQGARVHAYEGDGDMIGALHDAIIRSGHDGQMEASVRDLLHEPLDAAALAVYDGLVINPPRNGALPQIQHIAKSCVARMVMVSCNPATFRRDAQALIAGGFALENLIAVDQFHWSSHLELVAYFSR